MSSYNVDRFMLEAHTTSEILRILKDERDDYTPEAIKIFEEILEARGVSSSARPAAPSAPAAKANFAPPPSIDGDLIRNPTDARRMLDDLLRSVLDGSVDPQVGKAAAAIVMSLLRAMEMEYMTEYEEEEQSCPSRNCR